MATAIISAIVEDSVMRDVGRIVMGGTQTMRGKQDAACRGHSHEHMALGTSGAALGPGCAL